MFGRKRRRFVIQTGSANIYDDSSQDDADENTAVFENEHGETDTVCRSRGRTSSVVQARTINGGINFG